MKIIYNKYFPLGHYWAINICGIVFARKDFGMLTPTAKNHEYIHTMQQRELLVLFFYLMYVFEWLIRFIQYRNLDKAYEAISFEREAYSNEHNLNYRTERKHFAWTKFLSKKLN